MLMDSRVEILYYDWVILIFSYLMLVRNVSLLITPVLDSLFFGHLPWC